MPNEYLRNGINVHLLAYPIIIDNDNTPNENKKEIQNFANTEAVLLFSNNIISNAAETMNQQIERLNTTDDSIK